MSRDRRTFGETLSYYRDEKLGMTQTQLAQAISETSYYHLTQKDVAAWERDEGLDLCDEGLYSILEQTLVTVASQLGWADEDVAKMTHDLSCAYHYRASLRADPSNCQFGSTLARFREKLGLTQTQLYEALADDVPSRDYVANVEAGRRPSLRFILATAQLFSQHGRDGLPILSNVFDRASYLKLGIEQRNTAIAQDCLGEEKARHPGEYRRGCLVRELNYVFGAEEAVSDRRLEEMSGIGHSFFSKLRHGREHRRLTPEKCRQLIASFDAALPDHPDFLNRRERLKAICASLQNEHLDEIEFIPVEQLPARYGITKGTTRNAHSLVSRSSNGGIGESPTTTGKWP